ncbi:phosphate/phosphite/phosphonate ABC transporter substrate-binding protein [uncultured Megasphaera sp.]|uniref:substrate-binding domain-containing protein n=1 Tax=uncultured Megasphaera sp. TaxID=165188 RepID=UPI0025DC3828|nr:phosphate/phosphite/phosphonate ABC transporter substrate-binding protein [uncultured Megasphaera sp.]
MKRVISMILLSLACLFIAACAHPEGYIDFTQPQGARPALVQPGEKPLRIAFASVMSPRETRQVYQQIVTYISQKQQRPAVLIQRRTYEELNALLANGDADVAFSSTGAYAAYQGQVPIELLAMAETNGSSHYQTYIITAADSDIRDFSQLRGRVFAFTDPLSYSGCLAVKFLLAQEGETPETFFNRFFYTHGHDKSLWSVANHLADAAGVDSQIYELMADTNPALAKEVRILDALPEAPTGPVVVRSDLDGAEKEELRHIFYTMHKDEDLAKAMKTIVIDRFIPPDAAAYDDFKRQYAAQKRLAGT